MKILITGVAGLIGANLAHWILENTKDEVVGIDNLSVNDLYNLPPTSDRFCYFIEDITKGQSIDNIFELEKPDVCFHFAAYAAEGRSNYIRSFIHFNNTMGTANIINACVNHNCKLIFTSSVAVYSGRPPYSEETIPRPIDEYALSKLTSEKSIEIAGETQGLDWCIIRPRNVYGQYQSIFDSARNVMGIWCYQIRNNQPMTIFGSGSHKRCFTYIDDILPCLYKSVSVSKEIINLGSPKVYSIKEANDVLQRITGYNKVEHLEERHEVPEAVCHTLKSELLLNYEFKTDLLAGLSKMWDWAEKIPMKDRIQPPKLETTINAHKSLL